MPALTVLLNWLNALLAIVPTGTALWNALTARKTLAEQIIADNRNPTDAEWDQLNADTATKEAMIDSLTAARVGG
jgi:hypothetical protein